MPHGAHRKRKERDPSDSIRAPPPPPPLPAAPKPEPPAGNRLLAGYLAHEFLSKGTLFGNRLDPAEPNRKPDRAPQPKAYADVARVLKADGVHVPGVVNPTQLARWLQM
ncbi:hypothetical protein J5N97_028813 [Dioscorea zingiberensis]|uniref:Embryo sac development arrest 6 n=1 Tax=Dioscorea zingiberensis TaxID=325984 RepID=A0A9D5H552_9LILI|nr:hypothetical protein J5N97_028813 [Dioscorea zingiberensis]